MEKKFAYLDEGGIMHLVSNEQVAKDNAKLNGKVVATGLEAKRGGYPSENGDVIFVYAKQKEFYANDKTDNPITEEEFAEKYPQVYALYEALR